MGCRTARPVLLETAGHGDGFNTIGNQRALSLRWRPVHLDVWEGVGDVPLEQRQGRAPDLVDPKFGLSAQVVELPALDPPNLHGDVRLAQDEVRNDLVCLVVAQWLDEPAAGGHAQLVGGLSRQGSPPCTGARQPR